jgi:CheY-like chemotaxis protein/tetratricopeptide (TPR) repeat protein
MLCLTPHTSPFHTVDAGLPVPKQNLLLVDADPRSRRVLEVSLRKAGYSITAANDVHQALDMVMLSQPDLILADTRLGDVDGFQLVEKLRQRTDLADIPFIFLSSDTSLESKVRGLELGVEYLTKPIYIKEVITRVNLELQRKARKGLELKTTTAKTRFSGSLTDMGLVDLLQTVDISRKSGVLYVITRVHRGAVYFRDGHVIDAEMGTSLRGEAALYRMLIWNEGSFEVEFRDVRRDATIAASTQALLMEGMRRVDEWGRLLEQLPPLDRVFDVSDNELVERLAEIPDEINLILRHFDGRKSLAQVVDAAGGDDLETLSAISKLYFEGLIFDTGQMPPEPGEEVEPEAKVDDEVLEEDVVPGETPLPGPLPQSNGPASRAEGHRADLDGGETITTSSVPSRAGSDRQTPATSPASPGTGSAAPGGQAPRASASFDVSSLESRPRSSDSFRGSDSHRVGMRHGAEPVSAANQRTSPGSGGTPAEVPRSSGGPGGRPGAQREEAMGRKGKRRAKQRRASLLPAVQVEAAEVEHQSNVIQFRAKTAVAHGSSQVAVNDDVTETGATSRREASEAHRIDDEPETDEADRLSEPVAHEEIAETSPGVLDADDAEGDDADEEEAAVASPADEVDEVVDAGEPEAVAADAGDEIESVAADETDDVADAASDDDVAAAEIEPAPETSTASAETSELHAAPETSVAPETTPETTAPAAAEVTAEVRAEEVREVIRSTEAREAAAEEAPREEPPREETKEDEVRPAAAAVVDAPKESENGRKRRPKATSDKTTSSATIKALTITGEHPMVAEDFFRAPNYEAQQEETWEDLKRVVEPLPPGAKNARLATYGILGVAVVVIGGWFVYSKVFSVQPDPDVGGVRVADLPDVANMGSPSPAEPPSETAPREAAVPPEPAETAEATETETAEATETETAEATETETAEATETPPEPAAPTGEYATLLAEAQRLRGRRAEEAYRAAIAANPNGVEALSALAFSLLNRRQNQEAADLAGRATAIDATNSQAWITLGAARQELRDAAGARQAYQACVDQGQGRYVSDCRLMLQSMR